MDPMDPGFEDGALTGFSDIRIELLLSERASKGAKS